MGNNFDQTNYSANSASQPNIPNPPIAQDPPTVANAPIVENNKHKNVGPIVSTLVIVLILIIAALYLFASRINKQPIPADTGTTVTTDTGADSSDSVPAVAPITGTSSDPASIQKDLNSATNGLDSQNF